MDRYEVAIIALAGALVLSQALSAPVRAASPVYVDEAGSCNGLAPCVTGIQAGVNNATDPDGAGGQQAEVFVFPGIYAESVDLSQMGSGVGGGTGDLRLVAVDAAGIEASGSATIDPGAGGGPGTGRAVFNSVANFPGNLTLDGFVVDSPDNDGLELTVNGDLLIADLTADGTALDGVQVVVDGTVTVSDSQAGDNVAGFGFTITANNLVTVNGCTANRNGLEGISVLKFGNGDVNITGCVTNGLPNDDGIKVNMSSFAGNVSLRNCVANDNGFDGLDIDDVIGNVSVRDCTTNGNFDNGVEIECDGEVILAGLSAVNNDVDNSGAGNGLDVIAHANDVDQLTIRDSDIRDNEIGIDLSALAAAGAHQVSGCMVCTNTSAGLRLQSNITLSAEGVWWGDASGPTHPSNGAGTGDLVLDSANGTSGTVDFGPWIDTIAASSVSSPTCVPSQLAFQFTDGGGAVFLGPGPGDPNTAAPFTIATDLGVLVTSTGAGTSVIEPVGSDNGTLSLSLSSAAAGLATVTLSGPCGLNRTVDVEVLAAQADLALTGTAAPEPVVVDRVLIHVLTVANGGPCQAGGVILTDTLSEGERFFSATLGCSESDGVVTCDLGALDVGRETTVVIAVVPEEPGTIQNVARVVSSVDDPDPSNNVVALDLTVQPSPEAAPHVDRELLRWAVSLFWGVPICGAGAIVAVPITLLGVVAMRVRLRRGAHR